MFWIISILYFIGTYYFFELINYIVEVLRDKNVYLEFGHASILLIEIWLLCQILSILNIIAAGVRKTKLNKG
jgi:hypothetical protein